MSDNDEAIRGAVFQYLAAEHPVAARRMRSQLDVNAATALSDAELDAHVRADRSIRNIFGTAATFSSVLTSAFIGTNNNGVPTEKKAKSATPRASPKLGPSSKPAGKPQRRQRSASTSSDNEAAIARPASATAVATAKPAQSPAKQPAKPQHHEQQQHEETQQEASEQSKQQKERFCRIDVANVKFHDERLKDNRPGVEAAGFRQNQLMMAVRGKEFNKHKQKNKAKLYAAGVDQTIRSFKFSHDEEE